MTNASRQKIGTVLIAAGVIGGCGRPRAEPPVAPDSHASAGPVAPSRRYAEADVRFMQRMIDHHAQALAMTALVPTRAATENVRVMAQRVDVSQRDEIARMRRWLAARGEHVPTSGGHDHGAGGSHAPMPGMLSPDEMRRLAEAAGAAFDRLFLESMIRHHEGALVMVAELFATDGAGQELEIFRFASDVDADQRAEIRRMRLMLQALPGGN